MNFILRLFTTSLGKKFIMGATGAALFAFVIIHMVGNLQIFLGRETLNVYAKLLKASPELLWGFRIGLLAMAVAHVVVALNLAWENRRARAAGYREKRPLTATLASRTMAVSGILVASFIVFHILHFTVMSVFDYTHHLEAWEGHHDVFGMVVEGFKVPWVSAVYIVSVGLLSVHLAHGAQSIFHSLGLINPGYEPLVQLGGRLFAVVVFLGMGAVPAAVLLGLVKAG